MKFLVSLFAVLIMTESCNSAKASASADEAQSKTDTMQNTLSGSYTVSEIGNTKDVLKALTINFDESTHNISGFSGCNTFYGQYSINGNTIELSNIFASKKFCGKAENTFEQSFLSQLKKVNTFSINGDAISLSENDTVLLKADKNVGANPSRSDVVKENYKKILVTYQVQSRGMYEYIQISESDVKISSDRNLKNIKSYNCEAKDWEAIERMMKSIDEEEFQKLKAPTDKRLYDGAAHATLSIIRGDVEWMTPSFDHGAPPKEIEALVNKVLSVKENVSKQ